MTLSVYPLTVKDAYADIIIHHHRHISVLRDYGNLLGMEDFGTVCEAGMSSPEHEAWVK